MLLSNITMNQLEFFKAKMENYVSPMGYMWMIEARPDAAVVVDVRLSGDNVTASIPGAIKLPATEVEARMGELPKDKLLVLMCWDTWCGLSTMAAVPLLENGYKVKELSGGWAAWNKMNFPVEELVG
jgi:rhodanese-related sulfurtransferase